MAPYSACWEKGENCVIESLTFFVILIFAVDIKLFSILFLLSSTLFTWFWLLWSDRQCISSLYNTSNGGTKCWIYFAMGAVGNRPWKCDLCPAAFCRKPYLDIHQRTHTGERYYYIFYMNEVRTKLICSI